MKLSTSDWVLLAYIFLLVPLMLIGFGFARRKLFVPHHKLTMTTITIVNWILILTVMVVTYDRAVAPGVPQDLKYSMIFIPTLHALFGITAQVLATYLVIRMWFENQLPARLKVQNIKIYMRTTLALWLLTALFGLTTWAVFNRDFLSSRPAEAAPLGTAEAAPARTKDATSAVPVKTLEATPAATKAVTLAPATTSAATSAVTPAVTPAATKAATQSLLATPATTKEAAAPVKTIEATPAPTQDIAPARTKEAAPAETQDTAPVQTATR